MVLAEGCFGEAPLRVSRVSFTGERSYELSVPASTAPALWTAMREAGRDLGVGMLGIEALMILRAEKGVHRHRQGHERDDAADRLGRYRPAGEARR